MRSRPVGFVAVIFAACLSAACGDTPTGPTAPTPPATESQGSRDPGTAHPPNDPADRPTTPVPPPPAPDRSSCDERNVEWAIGQPATAELLERARVAAGAESARFLRLNEPITLEYRAGRLNLGVDLLNIVWKVSCG